jgi:hypothetical protein
MTRTATETMLLERQLRSNRNCQEGVVNMIKTVKADKEAARVMIDQLLRLVSDAHEIEKALLS